MIEKFVKRLYRMIARWTALPLWVRALAIYTASATADPPGVPLRLVRVKGRTVPTTRTTRRIFLEFLALSWDGGWYREIAMHGYPAGSRATLARAGRRPEPWAFYPLFPFLARAVMIVTRLPWAAWPPLLDRFLRSAAAAVMMVAYLVNASRPPPPCAPARAS